MTSQERADGITALYIDAIRSSRTPLPEMLERLAKLLGFTTVKFDDLALERDALRATVERLTAALGTARDTLAAVAAPLHINGDDHAAAVKHARAYLKEKTDGQ